MSVINISVVLLPCQESLTAETHQLSWELNDVNAFRKNICSILQDTDFLETPLLRPRGPIAGLYAYYNTTRTSSSDKNIRASRLAMACGLLAKRFYGNVLVIRSFGGRWEDLHVHEIVGATEMSPDLRQSVQSSLANKQGVEPSAHTKLPTWLLDASQQNYHDGAALAKVVSAMTGDAPSDGEDDDDDDDSGLNNLGKSDESNDDATNQSMGEQVQAEREFVAKSPLCLHCRGPTSSLCPDCHGAYFCPAPRSCRDVGWSHWCQCSTWNLYSSHRTQLSSFGFLGEWHKRLMGREFQIQDAPYEDFLKSSLGIDPKSCNSWWRTEMGGGWSGGQGDSASMVDASIRRSYEEGFAPITDFPPERRITENDAQNSKKNVVGLVSLASWEDYYALRGISKHSPVALLCTFPLTVYYAIEQYGEVPVTVAKMLKRKLRIHIVGAEKEMNILDLFKEVGFLLPEDLQVELIFIVRPDMLPPKCQTDDSEDGRFSLKIEMTTNLTVGAVSGTYGDSLDPNFDCGTGPPDMVIALNAGLFAYESWRSVVTYLYHNTGVVGVFSDYNEYSGMNCAALGGGKSRESLTMNPFRQPRAMPVYSMNLPQFSNGFLYVFNAQELD